MNSAYQPQSQDRLRRMLIAGIALGSLGLLAVLGSLRSIAMGSAWVSGSGLLALLFGTGLIASAWIGFVVVGAWQFRLRTMLIAITILGILLAAWPAWIGPRFFSEVSLSMEGGELVLTRTPTVSGPNLSGVVRAYTVEWRMPLFQLGLWVPVFFPLLLLPFVLRRRTDVISSET